MRRLQIIYLLLSSVLLFSCSISRYKKLKSWENSTINRTTIAPVIKDNKAVKFKATIDILKNHLSGLLIVKQTDTAHTHMVFVTELGMKMFDFELTADSMKTVYVFEPLNKPALIQALKKNFGQMLLLDIYGKSALITKKNETQILSLTNGKQKRYFVTENNALVKQQTYYKNKKESLIIYNYNPNTAVYEQITCRQFGLVKFDFELNAIQ